MKRIALFIAIAFIISCSKDDNKAIVSENYGTITIDTFNFIAKRPWIPIDNPNWFRVEYDAVDEKNNARMELAITYRLDTPSQSQVLIYVFNSVNFSCIYSQCYTIVKNYPCLKSNIQLKDSIAFKYFYGTTYLYDPQCGTKIGIVGKTCPVKFKDLLYK